MKSSTFDATECIKFVVRMYIPLMEQMMMARAQGHLVRLQQFCNCALALDTVTWRHPSPQIFTFAVGSNFKIIYNLFMSKFIIVLKNYGTRKTSLRAHWMTSWLVYVLDSGCISAEDDARLNDAGASNELPLALFWLMLFSCTGNAARTRAPDPKYDLKTALRANSPQRSLQSCESDMVTSDASIHKWPITTATQTMS